MSFTATSTMSALPDPEPASREQLLPLLLLASLPPCLAYPLHVSVPAWMLLQLPGQSARLMTDSDAEHGHASLL